MFDKIIDFITLEEKEKYEIFAVFKTVAYNQNGFKYYEYINFNNENEFNTFINKCKELSFYETNVKPKYEEVGLLWHNARMPVKRDGKWGYIDPTGKEIIAPIYEEAQEFSRDGLAGVKLKGHWGYIRPDGTAEPWSMK